MKYSISVLAGLLTACGPSAEELFTEVSWERTQVSTVIRVNWSLQQNAEAWVEFGPEGDCARWKTDVHSGTTGEALLMGLPPVTDSCFAVKAQSESEVLSSEEMSFRTENLPVAFEAISVEELDPSAVESGFWIGSNAALTPTLAYVLDRQGNYVWAYEGQKNLGTPQMMLGLDGQSFFFNEFNRNFSVDESRIVQMGFDGVEISSIDTPAGHHSFDLLSDGRVAYLALDVRDTEEWGPVVGDALWIVDGTESVKIYSTWEDENIILEPHASWDSGFFPQGHDWTHANYVAYNAERESFTLSFANAETVVEIDAESGEHLRSVGKYGTHELNTPKLIGRPHSAYWTEDGSLLFFSSPQGAKESIALELRLDDTQQSATVDWSYGQGLNWNTLILGEAIRQPNGNTLVNFGSKGIVEEVSDTGEPLWRIYTATGTFTGHMVFLSDFYGN
jgi:hypothetical protein